MFDKDNKFGFISNNESNNNIEGLDKVKTDIKNIKDNVNELNTQYKDLENKINSGNIGNNVEPQDSDIPKVFFNGEKPTSKSSVHATMEYKSKTEHFKGYVDIKCQGTSSMAYPKKNYTIKMFTDSTMSKKVKKDFKGWGKQSKFCLKANYIDHSHARNICSAKLWSQIVASRENYALLPELLRTSPCNGAIDGFPIKVYYNNNYEGIYTWNIPKDKWMFNMDDTLDNHCVLCGEEYNSGCFLTANARAWSDEIHDTMPTSIVTSFNAFQNFVINSTDDEFKANLENYVYVDSLIDYYIFQYVICGLDSMGKNQLFATYDGTKWIATSYDMDSTFGLYWNGQRFVSATYRMQEDYESGKNTQPNKLYVRLEKLFINEIKSRYSQLRADILSYNNIVNTFEPFMDIIGKDLYAEDLTIYNGIPSGSTNNIQQIRNYYRDRLVYVDAQIDKLVSAIACTNITLNNATLSFTTSDTQTLTATVTPTNTTDTVVWSVNPTGICTVNNGVVTPTSNGQCTITATCGTKTATCNVTVDLPSVACDEITLDRNSLELSNTTGAIVIHTLMADDLEHDTPEYNINPQTGEIITEQVNDTRPDSYVTKPIDISGMYCIDTKSIGFGDYFNYISIALYDTNMSFISYKGGVYGKFTYMYNIPSNAKYARFTITPSGIAKTDKSLFNITVYPLVGTADGVKMDNQGVIGSGINHFSSYYKIDGQQTINLSGANWMSIICYDSNANFIHMTDEIDGASTYSGSLITVDKTKYIQVQYYQFNTGVTQLTLNINNNPLTSMTSDEVIEDIENSSKVNSYQLKATVTPENCTESVIWSVSPEGIATVDNGLVKAVSNGETVVTATCGSHSATCNVTVSGISTPPSSALYTLPQETTFNGSSDYVDTGVQLFKTDQDFTITMDVTADTQTSSKQTCIMHCMKEQSPYPGMVLQNSYPTSFVLSPANNTSQIGDKNTSLIPISQRTKLVIVKNGTTMKVYNSNNFKGESAYKFTAIDQTLILGAYQTIDGTKGRFFKGTIHEFSISNTVYTKEQINDYLGITSQGRVFKIDSTCMNTTDNTLTDSIGDIEATLVGAPTVSDNQIVFTVNDTFNFDLTSLNLTSKNRTFRIKFTPTSIPGANACTCVIGQNATDWDIVTSIYTSNSAIRIQHGDCTINGNTVGSSSGRDSINRLPNGQLPSIDTEYEIIISEEVNTNKIRWFINGTLIQDGTTELYNLLFLANVESTTRFVGSYSLIEIYDVFCDTYNDFTNIANK